MKPDLKPVPESIPEYSFKLVQVEHVPMVWPSIIDMLRPAVETSDGRWNMGSLLSSLCTGNQQLWIAQTVDGRIDAAMTTQIVTYPHARMLAIHFLGGKNYDVWNEDWMNLLKDYADVSNCNGIEAIARKGFTRFARKQGFDHEQTLFTLIL